MIILSMFLATSIELRDYDAGVRTVFDGCLVFRDDTELNATCEFRTTSSFAGPAVDGALVDRFVVLEGVFVVRENCTRSGPSSFDCGDRVFSGGFER